MSTDVWDRPVFSVTSWKHRRNQKLDNCTTPSACLWPGRKDFTPTVMSSATKTVSGQPWALPIPAPQGSEFRAGGISSNK